MYLLKLNVADEAGVARLHELMVRALPQCSSEWIGWCVNAVRGHGLQVTFRGMREADATRVRETLTPALGVDENQWKIETYARPTEETP